MHEFKLSSSLLCSLLYSVQIVLEGAFSRNRILHGYFSLLLHRPVKIIEPRYTDFKVKNCTN